MATSIELFIDFLVLCSRMDTCRYLFLNFLSLGLLGFWLHVGSNEKLSKQHEQRQNVHHIRCDYSQRRRLALRGHEVGSLRHHGDKLEQLQARQAGLPPNRKTLTRGWHLCVHANEVVRVHHGVDKAVQDNGEVDVPVVVDVGIQPVKQKDRNVVVDMQERELTPLLAQDNEDSVPKVPNFRNIKQPEQVCEGRILLVVSDARKNCVVITIGQEQRLDCHVCTQHDLRNVVDELDRIRIHCRHSQLHDGRPHDNEQEVRKGDVECRGKIRKWPTLKIRAEA